MVATALPKFSLSGIKDKAGFLDWRVNFGDIDVSDFDLKRDDRRT